MEGQALSTITDTIIQVECVVLLAPMINCKLEDKAGKSCTMRSVSIN